MASFTHKFSPLKPSNLRIASGPLSPASPLTPPYSRRVSLTALVPISPLKSAFPPPQPPQPLQWLWSCHLCHQRYSLGATRRCLQDGHLFCSGVAVSKRTGAIKKRVACASEFDYVGWKAWTEWRQETQRYTRKPTGNKDCFNSCTYPSECRWGKKHTVDSPTIKSKYVAYSPVSSPPAPSKTTGKPRSSLFLDKLIKTAERKSAQAKGNLSPVEEEEAHASTSPSSTHDQLPDLHFPKLSLESKDDAQLPEDTLMSDSDSDSEDGAYGIYTSLHNAIRSERPKFAPDSMQSEETTTVERIIECASAESGFSFNELSPTSPGRRNAWDWSIEVPDGKALSGDLDGEEQVVWEKEGFFDVEMS